MLKHNINEFERVPGLLLENWTEADIRSCERNS